MDDAMRERLANAKGEWGSPFLFLIPALLVVFLTDLQGIWAVIGWILWSGSLFGVAVEWKDTVKRGLSSQKAWIGLILVHTGFIATTVMLVRS